MVVDLDQPLAVLSPMRDLPHWPGLDAEAVTWYFHQFCVHPIWLKIYLLELPLHLDLLLSSLFWPFKGQSEGLGKPTGLGVLFTSHSEGSFPGPLLQSVGLRLACSEQQQSLGHTF